MERLYWTDPTRCELEVEVTALHDRKITLDPILFHPDEGGQPADKGRVGGATVQGVRKVDGQIILSLNKPLENGRHMVCVDRTHRMHTASQHSAQHILSGLANTHFDLKTVGVHIGLERSTVDFETKLDWPQAQSLECHAMDVVMENLVIETVFK